MSLLPLLPQWRTDMSTQPDSQISSMEGAEALPRLNGELVFEEPWEGRAFGIAVALNNQRVYEWRDFREHLVGQISSDEKAGTEAHYYDQWLRAMQGLLVQQGLVTSEELERRTDEFASGQREDHEHEDGEHGHGDHGEHEHPHE